MCRGAALALWALWAFALPSPAQAPSAACVEPTRGAATDDPKCCVIKCDASGEHCACPRVLPDGRKQPLSDRDCEALLRAAPVRRTPEPARASTAQDKPAEKPVKNVDLVTPERRKHILDGDEGEKGGGGHRPGTGKSNKTEFPKGWSDEKIIHEISDVATDPASVRTHVENSRMKIEGTRDGVLIRVIIDKDGKIVTGYPLNMPRNR